MFSINSFLSKAAVAAALLFPVQAAAQCVIDKPALYGRRDAFLVRRYDRGYGTE